VSDVFQGSGVSPGVAVGEVLLKPTQAMPIVPAPVPPERLDEEIARLHAAREQARTELTGLRDRIRDELGEHYAGILEAQLLIVDDPRLVADVTQRIRVGRVTADWALKEVIDGFTRAFDAVDDRYLRERVGDLDDVHRRLQRLLRGSAPQAVEGGEGPRVIVAHSLGPSDAAALAQGHVIGVATDVGGPTSHTAILAQALGIPAVVGLHDISKTVRSGDPIVVDGDRGRVEVLPSDDQLDGARERQAAWKRREQEMASDRALPTVTRDGVDVILRANIELPREVERATRFGAAGIGLYRSEFLFLSRSPELPTEEDHYRTYRRIGELAAPHPAVVRTLDLGGEKYFHEVLDREEPNPILGLRGIRLCLKRPDIFRPQLRGLLRASAHADIQVMLPLVSSPEELRIVRGMLDEEGADLQAAGFAVGSHLKLGTMIEVPAAAVVADLLAKEADFFSIGTNDLIQYALAVDRGNESVSYLYQPQHPALLRMLRFIVDSARENDIPVSLCGEMAADPAMTGLLLGVGLREFSVQPRAVGSVRKAIREGSVEEGRELVERALDCTTAEEVHALLQAEPLGRDPR
jgi:phosphotransferase system enzyme I (PtsI)